MSVSLGLLGMSAYESAVRNTLPTADLRGNFARTVTRHLGVLGRLGIKAYLSGDFGGLALLAAEHRGDGFDLMPMVNPAVMPQQEAFWLALGVGDRIIGCTAAVYTYIPAGQTLRQRIEDMTLFYAAPEVARSFGASANCRAPVADQIGGHVMMLAAGWIAPDQRGNRLIEQAVRLCGLAGFARWSPDWVVGLVEAKFPQSLVADLYGFLRRDTGVRMQVPGWSELAFTLGSATRAEYEREILHYRPVLAAHAEVADLTARAWWSGLEGVAAAE